MLIHTIIVRITYNLMNFCISSTSRRQQLFLSDFLKVVLTTVSSENAMFSARIISVYISEVCMLVTPSHEIPMIVR